MKALSFLLQCLLYLFNLYCMWHKIYIITGINGIFMVPFLCNNFILEITKHIYKYPSIKPHLIIVWVIKVILFAFLSLQDLFKSHESSRLKRKTAAENCEESTCLLILTCYNHSSSSISALWSAFRWDISSSLTSQPSNDSGPTWTPFHITAYHSCGLPGCTQ